MERLKQILATFQKATQTGIPCGTLEIVIQEVLWSIRGSCWAIWSNPLTNVKWHSDPWPTVTSLPIRLSTNFMTFIPSLTFTELWVVSMEHLQRVWLASRERLPLRTPGSVPLFGGLACALIVETSFPRLYTNLMTVPNLTFTELKGFHGAFATGVASQQGALTLPDTWFRPPFWDLLMLPIVETKFLELAMSLLDFSPRIPLGTFSILLWNKFCLRVILITLRKLRSVNWHMECWGIFSQ